MDKTCESCKTSKPLSEFSSNKKTKDGLNKKCRECYNSYMREYYRKNSDVHKKRVAATPYQRDSLRKRANVYGVTVEQLKTLMGKNDGLCDICQIREATHIDHCHKTGAVRGFLCRGCNMGLGHFADSVEYLARAIEYLAG